MITLPVIAAVTTMASVAVGVAFLGDAARLGPARAVAAGLVTLATGAAIVALARSAPSGRRPSPPDGLLPAPVAGRIPGQEQHRFSRTDNRVSPAQPVQPVDEGAPLYASAPVPPG
jgi:hypothetical protein